MTSSTRDRDGIRDAVMAELSPRLRQRSIEEAEIDDSFDLFGSGLLDSIAFVDLLLGVETRLEQRFDLEQLDFDRLTDLAALVAELDRVRADVSD